MQPVQQEQPLAKKAQPHHPAQPQQQANCQYIDNLSQAMLQSTVGQCVLIDPGWCNLLFAMHEDSSVEKKHLYQYTRNQQCKEMQLTKFKWILEKAQKADTEDIAALERTLGAGSCIKPDLELYKVYLEAWALVANQLTHFYNEMYTVHPTSTHQIHMFKTSVPQAFPLYCKLGLSAYVNWKQADQCLGKKLHKEFGPNTVIVIGDWLALMAQFHKPIGGKSWQMLLKHTGFNVYLIKEYLTAKTCPNCNGGLVYKRMAAGTNYLYNNK
ncbi:hypothetical protein GGH96_005495 [Coemansia sp. RSA 1972]|nr:hypothetical protein GGH96_005495 [Coemansia sp. RSA 1972]